MIKIFHKYARSVVLLFVSAVVVISMLFFGTGSDMGQGASYAIKVNKEEISTVDYYNYQRDLEERLRSSLGAAYSQFFTPETLRQQLNDSLVNTTLFRQFAQKLGLAVGIKDLNAVLNSFFVGNKQLYASYLQGRGLTAKKYEELLSKDLLAEKVGNLLQMAAYASQAEIKKQYQDAEKKLSINYLSFDPEKFFAKAATPTEEKIAEYYNENASEFEQPAKVSYSYSVLDPTKNLEAIEIAEEDIAIYYADNISDYTTPAQANLSLIKLNFSAEMDVLAQSEVKNTADEIFKKAQAGSDFKKLVAEFSEDAKSKEKGGELGWVSAKDLDENVAKAIFSQEKLGLLDPVLGLDGMYIVQVNEIKSEEVQSLEDATEQIRKIITERDAPAFLLAKADELFRKWKKEGVSLEELAQKNSLDISKTEGLLNKNQDPELMRAGLTKAVFENLPEKQQLIELGDLVILLQVEEHKEVSIPTLEEVKAEIINILKNDEAVKATQAAADSTLELAKIEKTKLAKIAAQNEIELTSLNKVSKKDAAKDFLLNSEFKEVVYAAPQGLINKVFNHGGKLYLAEISEVLLPTEEESDQADLKNYTEEAERETAQLLVQSLLNQLKVNAAVKIEPSYGTLN